MQNATQISDQLSGNNAVITTTFGGNIVVESGALLNVADATLKFSVNGKIIIKPGGRMFADYNVLLTSCSPTTTWNGVQVLGDPNLNFNDNWQGTFIFKESIIENAEIGIANYNPIQEISNNSSAGGRIRAVNSEINNCDQAVVLANYLFDSGHYFFNTDFTWDANFLFDVASGVKPLMNIYNNMNVDILGCNFVNDNIDMFYTGMYYRRSALYMEGENASINMQRLSISGTSYTSMVKGFAYGLYMLENDASRILGVRFECYRSIYQLNHKGTETRACVFTDMPENFQEIVDEVDPFSSAGYGLYMEDCTGYITTFNSFRYNSGAYKDHGIIVNSSGSVNNIIEYNSFRGCDAYGINCIDDNKGYGNSYNDGLSLRCNDFHFSNEGDIFINKEPNTVGTLGMGIRSSQGMSSSGINQPGLSAGNTFDSIVDDGNPSNGFHIYNVPGEVEFFTYYYHISDGLQEADGNMIKEAFLINEGTCAGRVDLSFEEEYSQEIINQISSSYAMTSMDTKINDQLVLRNTKEAALNSLVDGGDSEGLTLEVLLSNYSDAVELYYDLMSKSPSLSEKVMIEAINKEVTLPSSLLTLILKSNPTAAKSGKVQLALDSRNLPLDEYQRYMIDQGLYIVSQKEQLESQIAYHKGEINDALNKGINALSFSNTDSGTFSSEEQLLEFVNSDSSDDNMEAIITFLEGRERISDHYFLASKFMAKHDFDNVNYWLSTIESNFDLSEQRLEEYNDYLICYAISMSLYESNSTTLTEDQYINLTNISEKQSNDATGMALSMLIRFGNYDHVEYIPIAIEDKSITSPVKDKEPLLDRNYTTSSEVYPNPASNYLIIRSNGLLQDRVAMLVDVKGNILISKSLTQSLMELIDISMLQSGSYQLLVKQAGDILFSKKIEVVK